MEKNWQFWVILLVVIFIVIPVIIYGISVNAATKVIAANPGLVNQVTPGCAATQMARPPEGMMYVCKNDSWVLVNK